jgi:hypothetical protein
MCAGALFPWIRAWAPGRGFFEVSGFEGLAGDAGLILELGAVAAALTWSDRASNSRIAALVAGPFVVGVICLFILRIDYGGVQDYLASLVPRGGYGSILPAFWVAVLGAGVVTIAGGVQLWRARRRLSFNPGVSASSVAGTIGGIVGAIGGFMAGVKIAELFTKGAIAGVSTSILIFLAFPLAFLGAWVGAVGLSSLARSTGRR